ncbi:MAG: outer membrane beta-barrel protein [Bacteroidota bacterium]
MYRLIILVFLFINCHYSWSQRPNGRGEFGREKPAIGNVSGVLIDENNKNGIEFATITHKSKKDTSLGGGTISANNGEFKIEKIKVGRYFAEISFLGYDSKIVDSIFIHPRKPEIFLGKIFLSNQTTQLEGITIKGEKSLLTTKLDRKVFDVTKLSTTTGGSASDIMENIPSVQVDIDGNISMRGSSNITILIDGRPSGLIGDQSAVLEQIPAETIQEIEIITNPSAKFNPENMGGIINIVLKKEKRKGFNGSLNSGLNTNPGQNATLSLNYRTQAYNLFGSYSYRNQDRPGEGTSYRETLINDTLFILDQVTDGVRSNTNHTLNGGIDIYLNDKNTLYLSSILRFGDGTDEDFVLSNNYINNFQNFDFSTQRDAIEIEDELAIDLTLGYKKTFINPDRIWTSDLKITQRNEDEFQDFLQNNYTENGALLLGTNSLEKVRNEQVRKQLNFQSDYVHPFDENRKLEVGTQIILTENDGDYIFSNYDDSQDTFIIDDNISNRFIFNQDIYSVYGLFGHQINTFQYQIGLRSEIAEIKGNQVSSGQVFSFDYFSLFPSLHLSQKISEKQEIQLSYSRRIQRPRGRSLNPFEDFTDPNNIRVGNPELRPEYISSFELNHIIIWPKVNLTSGLYFRDIQNVMRRFRFVDDSTGVATSTFVNLDNSQNFGFEFILTARPSKKLRINASVDLFKSILDGSNLESELNNSGLSWSSRAMGSYSLPKSFDLQLSSRYLAPNVTAQGEWSGFFTSDISLKKSFLDRNLSLTLRLSDILDTREFSFSSSGENFYSEGFRKRKSRILNFSVLYRFGKFDDKRKGKQNGGRGGDDAGGFEPDF